MPVVGIEASPLPPSAVCRLAAAMGRALRAALRLVLLAAEGVGVARLARRVLLELVGILGAGAGEGER